MERIYFGNLVIRHYCFRRSFPRSKRFVGECFFGFQYNDYVQLDVALPFRLNLLRQLESVY